MTAISENPATFYISQKWHFLYERLCQGENKIFDKMASLFTLCATIGDCHKKEEKLKERKGIFRWSNLDANERAVLTAIAWKSNNRDLETLSNQKQIIEITMEFAEGGMQYLYDEILEDYFPDESNISYPRLELEFPLAQIIEGLRRKQEESIF